MKHVQPRLKLIGIMATFQLSLSEQHSGIFPVYFSSSLLIVQENNRFKRSTSYLGETITE